MNSIQITAFSAGITKLNQRIIWKDDIEFVTEFLCLLGHPVGKEKYWKRNKGGLNVKEEGRKQIKILRIKVRLREDKH